jgi:hypothetical protein
VYEYISERELRLISNLKIPANKVGELVIGLNTIKVDGNSVLINGSLRINIDTDKLCAKQKEAWDYLTFSANQNGIHPGVIIEKMCVLLASTLPAKLLYFTKKGKTTNDAVEIDMLTAMFNNLVSKNEGSSDGVSNMIVDNKIIDDYIEAEVNRINKVFASTQVIETNPVPIEIDNMSDSTNTPTIHNLPVRRIPRSFQAQKTSAKTLAKTPINGVQKIRKHAEKKNLLENVVEEYNSNCRILNHTIDKEVHKLSNLIKTAADLTTFYKTKIEQGNIQVDDVADLINAKAYLANLPAFGESLKRGIVELNNLKDKIKSDSSASTNTDQVKLKITKIKDHVCRIKAYAHATFNSYNHQHSVIMFGMGNPEIDYENPESFAMDLVGGLMGITLQDMNKSNNPSAGGRRKKPCQKGGLAMNFDVDDNDRQYIDTHYVEPLRKDYRLYTSAEIVHMYKELFKKIYEYKEGEPYFQEKKKFLLAEINICIDRTPYWPELEALYRYDVLDYTFAYARAQYGYGEGIQDEDGLYVTLIDNPPATSNLPRLLRSLSDPGGFTPESRGGRSKRSQKGGAPLTEEQLAAIDSIARQTGIVDLPTDMIENIVNYLTPYSALMMQLAVKEIPVDVATIRDAEIKNVIATLPLHAEKIRLYVYSQDSQWTLKPLPDILKGNFANYLQQTKTSELKTIVSVRFCNVGKVLKSPNPDPSRYIFKAALDAYVALLGPS